MINILTKEFDFVSITTKYWTKRWLYLQIEVITYRHSYKENSFIKLRDYMLIVLKDLAWRSHYAVPNNTQCILKDQTQVSFISGSHQLYLLHQN